jgi:hypothetical protein
MNCKGDQIYNQNNNYYMKNITFVVIMLAGLHSCRKPITHYPINASLKAAFNYKVGSYWIYRDSISGMIDSFYVTDNTYSNGTSPGDSYSIEQIEIRISEKNISPIPVSPVVYFWDYNYVANILEMTFYFLNNYRPTAYNPLVNYPFQYIISEVGYYTGPPEGGLFKSRYYI